MRSYSHPRCTQPHYQVEGPSGSVTFGIKILVVAVPLLSKVSLMTSLPHHDGNSAPDRPRASPETTTQRAVPMSRAPDRT